MPGKQEIAPAQQRGKGRTKPETEEDSMRLRITAKREIETYAGTEKQIFDFWAPDTGGYVRLESDDKTGVFGRQICAGGGFLGSTLSCSPASFDQVCRRWYRAYMRAARKFFED